ncbi:hypothetical protein JST97_36705 [bacterium]|nr:hypothetical protein [bacterium]
MKLAIIALTLLALALPVSAEEGGITRAGWSAGGKYLVTVGGNRRLRVHDGASGLVLKALRVPGDSSVFVSFSPDSGHNEDNVVTQLAVSGDYALTGSTDHSLRWWSLPHLKNSATAESTYGLVGLALSAQGQLASCTSTSTRYLDSEMSLFRRTDQGVKSSSFSQLPPADSSSSYGTACFSPDGHWAMAYTGSGVQLWNLAEDSMPSQVLNDLDPSGLALGNTHFFARVADGFSMRSYLKPEQEVRRFLCPGGFAWVDDAETHLLMHNSQGIWSWDLNAPEAPHKWAKKSEGIAVSPDLKRVALWQKNTLEIWDVPSSKMLYQLSLKARLREARR